MLVILEVQEPMRRAGRLIGAWLLAATLAASSAGRPGVHATGSSQGGTPSPGTLMTTAAWWQRVPVVVMPSTPGLDDLATVVGWGWPTETEAQTAVVRTQVANAHAAGRRYVSSISVYDAAHETYTARPDLAAAAVIDIDGQRVIVSWESQPGKPLWWGNTNLPVWQDFLIAQARNAVDAGVDGIVIDEGEGTAGSLTFGGSFGSEDMALFRAYLQRKYSAEELLKQYGITDPSTFDYGAYIRARGQAGLWKTNPYAVPLYQDFRAMQDEAARALLTRLVATTRDYARTRYGRYVTFSTNAYALTSSFQPLTPLMDYFSVEYPFVDLGYVPADTPIPELKLATALGGRTAWLLPSIYTVADWHGRTVDTLLRIYTAFGYAAGGALFAPYNIYGYSETTGPLTLQRDTTLLRPLYATIGEASPFFVGRTSMAATALIYSQASERHRWTQYRNSYRGTAHALLNAHLQYDVVPLGDGNGVAESPGSDGLARYSIAWLPSSACLSDLQVTDLLAWVSRGGTLILFGETATCDLQGRGASFPAMDPFRSAGDHAHGSGRVVTAGTDVGTAYRSARSPATLAQVTALLSGTPAQPATAVAPVDVGVLVETSRSDTALLVHMVNGDYDGATDTTRATGALTVTATLPGALQAASSLQAYRLSPDRNGPELLPLVRTGPAVTLASSALRLYDLLMVTTEALARDVSSPTVEAFSTGMAAAAAKGRDVSALVPTRDAIAAAVAADNHLLAAHLARGAMPAVNRLNAWRVLFSEAHNERNTMLASRAAVIEPDHPGWVLVSQMVAALSDEFTLERSEAPLTPGLLAAYDALVLPASRAGFQPAEIQAIHDHVEGGKGLLVVGDCGSSANLTAVTSAFGISFTGACAFSLATPPDGNLFPIDVASHDAVRGVTSLGMNWGTTLSVAAPAQTVVRTATETFADTNWNHVFDPGETTGPLSVVAVATSGQGRVVAASDNAIHDDGFEYWGNEPFVRAALRWLVRSTSTGRSLDLTPPTITISSPAGRAPYTTAAAIVMAGSASDASGVAGVSWSTPGGAHGQGAGTSSWTAGPIPLANGANPITIAAVDTAGNLMFVSTTVTRTTLTFTDDPLVRQLTPVRSVHVTELRQRIDELRTRHGLAAMAWTDSPLVSGVTPVRAAHLLQLRQALSEVYAAIGLSAPTFTNSPPVGGQTIIEAAHIQEIREAVALLW